MSARPGSRRRPSCIARASLAAWFALCGPSAITAHAGVPVSGGPGSALFAEGTDPDYIAEVEDALALASGSNYYLVPRWPGAVGSPGVVTWSLVPDGINVPPVYTEPASPNDLFARMDAEFATQGGRAAWIARIQACFDRWQELSGIAFVRESVPGQEWDDGAAIGTAGAPGARGDIRLTMHPLDGPNGLLSVSSYPVDGDINFDSAESWGLSTDMHRYLRNTVMRQLGNAIGLDAVCSNNSAQLMEGVLNTTYDGPQHDDIRGVHAQYGDPREDDNTPATANDLGVLASGTTLANACTVPPPIAGTSPANSSICSIDANSEVDWWSFSRPLPSLVSVTITPVGYTYDDRPFPCSSSPPHTTNSVILADLKLELVAADGTTVIATAPTQPLGAAETLLDVAVPSGVAYILVSEAGAPTSAQSYTLSITVQDDCTGLPDCNGNGVQDECDVAQGTSADANASGVPDECEGFVAQPFCAGDQLDVSFTPCPCNNAGATGHGCANSAHASGALLAATGLTQPADTLSLNASLMPAVASAIFLKGDANATLGIPFGDGVRCVDGNLIRLGTATSSGGACSYPSGAQPLVSVRGATPVGSGLVAYYQTYYRNAAAAFCPPETFNVTNGFSVTW